MDASSMKGTDWLIDLLIDWFIDWVVGWLIDGSGSISCVRAEGGLLINWLIDWLIDLLLRFVPRHHDEIEIDIGDPVYVQKEAEDLWCEGDSRID